VIGPPQGWQFTIPGQPPSWNHMYVLARGSRRIVKAPNVEAYQTGVALIAKTARPSHWKPAEQVRVIYRFYLGRDIDCDNVMKAVNDAIAAALDVDDKIMLPCAAAKSTGHREPYIEITVY